MAPSAAAGEWSVVAAAEGNDNVGREVEKFIGGRVYIVVFIASSLELFNAHHAAAKAVGQSQRRLAESRSP